MVRLEAVTMDSIRAADTETEPNLFEANAPPYLCRPLTIAVPKP